jgi:hypothetical protein
MTDQERRDHLDRLTAEFVTALLALPPGWQDADPATVKPLPDVLDGLVEELLAADPLEAIGAMYRHLSLACGVLGDQLGRTRAEAWALLAYCEAAVTAEEADQP